MSVLGWSIKYKGGVKVQTQPSLEWVWRLWLSLCGVEYMEMIIRSASDLQSLHESHRMWLNSASLSQSISFTPSNCGWMMAEKLRRTLITSKRLCLPMTLNPYQAWVLFCISTKYSTLASDRTKRTPCSVRRITFSFWVTLSVRWQNAQYTRLIC